jgi:hypothetical protein
MTRIVENLMTDNAAVALAIAVILLMVWFFRWRASVNERKTIREVIAAWKENFERKDSSR